MYAASKSGIRFTSTGSREGLLILDRELQLGDYLVNSRPLVLGCVSFESVLGLDIASSSLEKVSFLVYRIGKTLTIQSRISSSFKPMEYGR